MGKCPFHEDSSPSFLVDEKHYHCFGCKAHGNAIDFEMNRTGSGFLDAVETLANRFNFNLDYENNSKESEQDKAASEERRNLSHVMTEVTRAYAKYLWTKDGASALDYLHARGFTEENIKDWEIGLSPANNVLLKMAEKRGWSNQQLELAGLLKKRESAEEWYDFFRDRIMIPIRDDKGNPIALGGRVFKPPPPGRNTPPKYLNSPETPLFQKSKTLFNLHRARTAIVQAGCVVVVEGYMDCLALARAGFLNVVAVLGTALTPDHLKKLARLTKRVVICFDSDSAGRDAARRTFEIGFPLNLVELQYVNVPSGKDPDEFIRDKGVEAFKQLLDRAQPLSQWVCDFHLAQGNSREAQVRKIKSEFVPIVMRNPDAAVREITLESVAVVLGLSSVATLTSGVSLQPQRGSAPSAPEARSTTTGVTNAATGSGSLSSAQSFPSVQTETVGENGGVKALAVRSADEACFLIAFAHSFFSMLPARLQNVLQGRQSDEPMDEVVLAQLLSHGMSPDVATACLAWSEVQLQSERELALIDSTQASPGVRGTLPLIKAIASLDPEALLEAGLDAWVRGVLEPGQGGFVKPQLRNPDDLFDPVNLPFVRMTVRDVGVSRARNGLGALMSRTLAQLELAYLDSEIDQTNREIKLLTEDSEDEVRERDGLSQRLRKLAAERVRRYQKFVQRVPG